MINRLRILLQNKHTTAAAALCAGCWVAEIWFPHYADKLHKTAELIFSYGLLMAGDAKPSLPNP